MWYLTLALFSLYSLRDIFVSAACDVYLAQLQYTSRATCATCHLGGFGVNVWHKANTMNMGDGNSYQEFLVIHPEDSGIGYVEYALNGQYDTFSGIIGQANPSNGCEDSTSFGFKFKIYVDGNPKFESQTITNKAQFADTGIINVKNAMKLRLESINLGLNTCDHATIAAPKLVSTTNCCCTSNDKVEKARYFSKCQRFKNQENKCLRADDPDSGLKQCAFMFCGFVDGLCRVDKNYQGSLKGIKQKKNCRAVSNLNDCEAIPYCNYRIGVPPFQLEEAEELEIKLAEGKLDMEMFNNIIKGNQSSLYQSNYYNNILYIAIIAIAILLIIGGLYKYYKKHTNQYKHITSENNPLLINMQ